MLKPQNRAQMLASAMRPDLSYLQKKALRRRIHEQAKKQHTCPYCGAHNGVVKKLQLTILYDRLRNMKPDAISDYMKDFHQAPDVAKNQELISMAKRGLVSSFIRKYLFYSIK